MQTLKIDTPRWALPLYKQARYKGAKGGRSSGKSHERAEALVELMIMNKDLNAVCIREIQKSLKYSAKKLIESKIEKFNVSGLFEITLTEIRRIEGKGLCIFMGMQDHTADSIKSLEGFDIAWCEEAQSLSKRSVELLTPTFRKDTSELWFTWNPDQPDDAVEKLFQSNDHAICVSVNYPDNPWCPDVMRIEAEALRAKDLDAYNHIWMGGFNVKSDAQIFAGRYRIDEFQIDQTYGDPLYGMDFGFSNDLTCFVRCFVKGNTIYIDQDAGSVGLDIDATARYFTEVDQNVSRYAMRADSARPESISYLQRHGLPKIQAVKKWPGSVEDGIEFIK